MWIDADNWAKSPNEPAYPPLDFPTPSLFAPPSSELAP
jgi:hypothetical protein